MIYGYIYIGILGLAGLFAAIWILLWRFRGKNVIINELDVLEENSEQEINYRRTSEDIENEDYAFEDKQDDDDEWTYS